MEGINLFVYTHARAAELPSCLPKKGPKTHIIGIETPAIVRPKDPKGKECWGCGRSVGGTWTHTPWGPLCMDSSCGRVIRYNKQILELAVSGDAASASQKQGGYGCARQGQATVEDGLEIRHDYQSKWRLIRAVSLQRATSLLYIILIGF